MERTTNDESRGPVHGSIRAELAEDREQKRGLAIAAGEDQPRGWRKAVAVIGAIWVTLAAGGGTALAAETTAAVAMAPLIQGTIGIAIVSAIVADENVTEDFDPLTKLVVKFVAVGMAVALLALAYRGIRGNGG